MNAQGERTFLGFGFGAIQTGLFLYEAFRSGAFRRFVVAEVQPDVVASVRGARGFFTVNIAHPERVESARLGPVEIENPGEPPDRARLIATVAEAAEIATAVPSVAFYRSPGPGSLHRVLAAGFQLRFATDGPPVVVYAAENDNRAAEILEEAVLAELPAGERESVRHRVRFLNTVIGKMSGVVSSPEEVRERALAPLTPGADRAILVEAFNRILISAIRFEPGAACGFRRGIDVFREKPDLLPFEEAKLYGHNATHAAAAYLAAAAGRRMIADVRTMPGALAFLRRAFVEESGAALIKKYAGLDPLFTPEGYAAYADDLLDRMTNPFLGDTVERVGRDPERKLGWDDRLVGTLRLALEAGIAPRRFAMATAAALRALDPALASDSAPLGPVLGRIWGTGGAAERPERPEGLDRLFETIETGRAALDRWVRGGFGDPEEPLRDASPSRTM